MLGTGEYRNFKFGTHSSYNKSYLCRVTNPLHPLQGVIGILWPS